MGSGEASGGSTESTGSGGILWQIIWLILLVLAAVWVSWFCAWWYALLVPFTVCVPPLAAVTDVLLRGIQITFVCAKNMVEANTLAEAWNTYPSAVPPTVLVVAQTSG